MGTTLTMRNSPSKAVLTVTYLAIVILVFLYLKPIPGQALVPSSIHNAAQSGRPGRTLVHIAARDRANCQTNRTHLLDLKERYELNDSFKYAKRIVHFTRKHNIQRKSMTNLPQQLLNGDFQIINTQSHMKHKIPGCSKPLEVPVSTSPFPQNVDASDFMFGISTTYERFMESSTILLNDWAYWLTDGVGRSNGGKMILVLIDADTEKLKHAKSFLTGAGINADTITANSSLPMATRYLSLLPTMYAHRDARNKKWFVLCDDDTFFPNMHALKQRLAEYDHKREMYIGTLSEDIVAVQKHGSQAFGGAGVFLSQPTAERMSRVFSNCTTEEKLLEADWQGDRLLHQCILENSDTTLTTISDLWQLDMFGDPEGFYEWGTKPLSLHHYRSWHHATPSLYSKVAYICGEDCTLQRFQTNDDYIISGYSIAHYPGGITFDTHTIEASFRAEHERGWNFDYKFGPQRKALKKTGRKISWELKESSIQDDGCVLQTYIRRGNDTRWVAESGEPMDSSDGVIELVWGASGK